MTRALTEACRRHLPRHSGKVHVENLIRLSGGATRQMWSFDVSGDDGARLVFRRGPSDSPINIAPETEIAILRAARESGVPVPEVVFVTDESDEIGPGFAMERIEGQTIPRKILRDQEFAPALPGLAAECGRALAAIHAIDPEPLGGLTLQNAEFQIRQYRQLLDAFGQPHPAFEIALNWLEANIPAERQPSLVHGDFRLGNLIVGPDGLRSVLDWELAHLGDPMEDLGWLCVKSWRFGVTDKPVGGFGDRQQLFEAYENASGVRVDPRAVYYWEVFGNLKWGVICIVQTFRHIGGTTKSVELATLGRRVCETEYDVLRLLEGEYC